MFIALINFKPKKRSSNVLVYPTNVVPITLNVKELYSYVQHLIVVKYINFEQML